MTPISIDPGTLAAVLVALVLAWDGYQKRKRNASYEERVIKRLKSLKLDLDIIKSDTSTSDVDEEVLRQVAERVEALWACHLGPEAKDASGALKWWTGPQIDQVLEETKGVRSLLTAKLGNGGQ